MRKQAVNLEAEHCMLCIFQESGRLQHRLNTETATGQYWCFAMLNRTLSLSRATLMSHGSHASAKMFACQPVATRQMARLQIHHVAGGIHAGHDATVSGGRVEISNTFAEKRGGGTFNVDCYVSTKYVCTCCVWCDGAV